MFDKILVAIDETESSLAIFEQALALARVNKSDLMLLHVMTPFHENYLSDPYIGITPSAWPIFREGWLEQEQAGLERLRTLEERSTAAGIKTEFTQNVGDPGKWICALASSWKADLIIVGRRGISGVSELLIGSVSNYVLHHAPCHVLALKSAILQRE
jgi:nucleotide-binding universal stress UspA family protein